MKGIHPLLDRREIAGIKDLLGAVSRDHKVLEDLNLWSLLNNFEETSYSKLLAFLFDSSRQHGLGNRFFKNWIRTLKRKYHFSFPRHTHYLTRTVVEWPAGKKRRIDVLVKGYSRDGNTPLFVVALENKVNAKESNEQLSDYQAALTRQFSQVPTVLLLFTTPDGRAGQTLDRKSKCKVFDVAYSTLSDACSHTESGNQFIELMLRHLRIFATDLEFGDEVERLQQLKKLIDSKPTYKEAAKLIRRFETDSKGNLTIRNVMYETVLPLLRSIGAEGIAWHYPTSSSRPNEFNFVLRSTKKLRVGQCRYDIFFMLYSRSQQPDEGDSFTVHVMMQNMENWSQGSMAAAKKYRDKLRAKLPPDKMPAKESGRWICLWTGDHHQITSLKDAGRPLADLVIDAYRNTKVVLCKRASRHLAI
jgi:hypothetical protein